MPYLMICRNTGTALKILLMPKHRLAGSLQREEVVALFNTLGAFSESIRGSDELAIQYVPSPPLASCSLALLPSCPVSLS
jgi:hypothetical protein